MKDFLSRSVVVIVLVAATLVTACREPREGDSPVVGLDQSGEEVLSSVSDREYARLVDDAYQMLQSEAQKTIATDPVVDRVVVGASVEVRAGVPFVMEAESQSGVRFHFVRGKK